MSEDLNVKMDVIKSLNQIATESTILASNTSSISITKLATNYNNPQNFIGMHFMHPVPKMQLVELIKGFETSPETLDITKKLVGEMGKVFTCSEDIPGFIVNRILMPYINEAIFVLYEVRLTLFIIKIHCSRLLRVLQIKKVLTNQCY